MNITNLTNYVGYNKGYRLSQLAPFLLTIERLVNARSLDYKNWDAAASLYC